MCRARRMSSPSRVQTQPSGWRRGAGLSLVGQNDGAPRDSRPKPGRCSRERCHKTNPVPGPTGTGGRGPIAMANILVNIEKGIEIAAEDALKWLTGADKALHAAPEVVAALATLAGAVEKPLSELAGAAANPLNIPLDVQTVADLKAVWPQLQSFLASLGIKL